MQFPRLSTSVLAFLLSSLCLGGIGHAQSPEFDPASPTAVYVPGAQPGDSIVAVVNDDIITWRELNSELARAQRELRAQNIEPPPDDVIRQQLLERLITDRILEQEADRAGIRVSSEQIDAAIGRIAEENDLSVAELRTAVEETMPWSTYRNELERQIRINRLREENVDASIVITEGEIDAFLAEQDSQGSAGPANANALLHLAQILVRVPEGSSPDTIAQLRARAEDLRRQVAGGADFAQVAAAASDGDAALRGGDLGPRPTGGWPQLFIDATRGLAPGQISQVVQSGAGFHVLLVVDREQPQTARAGSLLPDTGPVSVTQSLVRHILIRPTAVTSDQAARQQLEEIRQRVLQGEDFSVLAREYSEDASAPQGGSIGWVSPGEAVPEFEAVVNSLEPGQMSEPFESPFGWHIVLLEDRRVQDVTERTRRQQARQLLFQRRLEPAWEEWIGMVRARAFVDNRLNDTLND